MYSVLKIKPEETEQDYCKRLYSLKEILELTWDELADIINSELGYSYSSDKYRKDFYRVSKNNFEDNSEIDYDAAELSDAIKLSEMKLERTKLSDERTQINAMYRRIAREDTIKEIAASVASTINQKFGLRPIAANPYNKLQVNYDEEAILEISDWHYGIEIDNFWNIYNPEIAKARIEVLRDEVIKYLGLHKIHTLHVVNLGDLIAGRIHLQLRMNSRFDVITQIIEVSELLAQFVTDLSAFAEIHYYDTLDNHSRLEPNLKESIDLESLARITTWYLKDRLADNSNITIHGNTFGDDIITFEVLGHKIIAVHGHKDKPTKVIDNLSMMTQQHYDLVLTAHLHHFSAEEKNETVLISNSSLMGTDDYAEKLRLSSKPSQNLIIVSKENAAKCIYKINLD